MIVNISKNKRRLFYPQCPVSFRHVGILDIS